MCTALLLLLAVLIVFGYLALPIWMWAISVLAIVFTNETPNELRIGAVAFFLIFGIRPLRMQLLSRIVMLVMDRLGIIPKISATERTALEAGVVWIEGDLFSGRPNFKKIRKEPYPSLTPEEKAFVDGPTEELCKMIDEWQLWKTREIPQNVWDFLKKERFLGMIVPKEYGGLAFSALAHSEVIMKISSRSIPVAICAMVPNSLGPAELLTHYGTEAQKKYYLPRLASGQEVPCFALTEPTAGSDASSIRASGVVFRGKDGKLYVRLEWNKRWITLAAISTVMGMAFRLRDPENLLGKGEDIGITCALIPSNAPGVVLGRRHDPMGIPFYNCPTQGKDVEISIDQLIGGPEMAGKGWGMLMECLSAGRGISLPAQSSGNAKLVLRAVSAHANIRQQFGMSIGRFEGVQEPLARIAGFTYLMEAMRMFTVGGLDKGLKPPVVTAIAKYWATELGRIGINDAMDILGGAGISRGPRNLLAGIFVSCPIGVTVEGANILTRTLMIFGQGALRAHPYAFAEVKALEAKDLPKFDVAFWGHMGHILSNSVRAVVLSATRGYIASRAGGGPVGRYYQKLSWASASFAILADVAMASLGGKLKQRENLTGRFADILSWMYIGSAVLRRFDAEGRDKADLPLVHYAMNQVFCRIQTAFDGIFSNLEVPLLGWFFKGVLGGWSHINPLTGGLSDNLVRKVADMTLSSEKTRDRLTQGMHIPTDPTQALGRLEHALAKIRLAQAVEKKIRKAIRKGELPKKKRAASVADEAVTKGVITAEERTALIAADIARLDAIQVDDFSQAEYLA